MWLNETLKIKYPLIQGGMANIATGAFAAAVSNAGGLGLIAGGGMSPEMLRKNIREAKKLTDKPFGVNLMLLHPQAGEMADIVVEEKVPVVTTGAGNPGIYIKKEKEGAEMMELEKYTLGSLKRAVFEGDVETGSLMSGQVAGMVHEERSLKDIIEGLFKEYEEEKKRVMEVHL